jgi:sugar lactone lactonase YvrE
MWKALILGLIGIALTGTGLVAANAQQVEVSSVATTATGLPNSVAGVALDACGNAYAVASGTGQVTEIPAGGGAPTNVANTGGGTGWSPSGMWIDAVKHNLYIANGKDMLDRIPIVNCALQTGSTYSINIGNLGAISWWYTANAIASDASGNIFIATNNACCADAKELIEENATSSTGTTLIASLPAQVDSMTVDSNNNIYFVSGGALYELAYGGSGAYAPAPAPFGGVYKNASGVSVDSAGNLYVTDNGASVIYEIPLESGSLNPNDQFVLAAGVAATSAVAAGEPGSLYFTNTDTSLYHLQIGSANLGVSAVGVTASATLGVAFNAAETPKTIALTAANKAFAIAGGTCAANTSYTAGQSCTVQVAFNPAAPGIGNSALTVTDSNGNPLAEGYLTGQGTGAGLTVDPGVVSGIGSGLSSPRGAAVDAAGNIFIADAVANRVYEVAAGSSSAVALGSGLSSPQGVAVDGAGNVFVVDTGNDRIVEIPIVGGNLATSAQSTVISSNATLAGSSLNAPGGIAIDGSGNLYIADTGNKRVLFVPFNGSWYVSGAVVLGSGMTAPSALALDTAGNIYVSDASAGDVFKLQTALTNLVQTTVVTGYSSPSGLAVDPSGALFVVDQGDQKVWRIPNLSGSLASSQAVNVVGLLDASGKQVVANPYGVALDASGNVYVTDNLNAAAYVVARTSSTQSAGTFSPGSTSSALSFSIENAGTSTLSFGTPFATATGDSADFSLLSGENDACASGGTVAAGSSCLIEADFVPATFGNFTYTLAIGSNSTNASSQSVAFTGVGAVTAATTTTVSQSAPSGLPAFDQAVSFNVTVASSQGTPVGSVSLIVDGIAKQTTALSNGTVSFTLAGGVLTGGNHSVQAKYIGGVSGFITYSASTSAVLPVSVTTVATSTALSYTTLYVSPASQPAQTPVVLTATVASTFTGAPTGTVSFNVTDSGGKSITGTGTLVPTAGGYQATYSYVPAAPASGVAFDVVSISATYVGDINFTGSTSASGSFDVSGAQGSIVTTPASLSITTSSTNSGSTTFNFTSYGGWTGVIGFSCDPKTLPADSQCVFSPGQVSVTPNTASITYPPNPVTFTLVVNQQPNVPTLNSSMVWWLAMPTGLLLLVVRRRFWTAAAKGRWNMVFLIGAVGALSLAIAGTIGCTSTGFKTPTGTAKVTVYASADPYVSGQTTTQSCSTVGAYPCFQQAFQVNVTVQ